MKWKVIRVKGRKTISSMQYWPVGDLIKPITILDCFYVPIADLLVVVAMTIFGRYATKFFFVLWCSNFQLCIPIKNFPCIFDIYNMLLHDFPAPLNYYYYYLYDFQAHYWFRKCTGWIHHEAFVRFCGTFKVMSGAKFSSMCAVYCEQANRFHNTWRKCIGNCKNTFLFFCPKPRGILSVCIFCLIMEKVAL